MKDLLPMEEEIDAIEQAFRELGQGVAMNAPRARLRTPWKEEGGQYYFNNIMGLVPGVRSMALRIDSSFSKEVQVAGSKRRGVQPPAVRRLTSVTGVRSDYAELRARATRGGARRQPAVGDPGVAWYRIFHLVSEVPPRRSRGVRVLRGVGSGRDLDVAA